MRPRTEEGELLHAILLVMLGIFFFIVVFCVPGCVSAPIAPNLKFPEVPPPKCPEVKPQVQECPKIDLPAIPKHVYIEINGEDIEADAGGELLLRAYVRARKALK